MVGKRQLPEKRNPLIESSHSPSTDILVERRRLGQTNLAVKPGIVGVSNASKAENLGTFDYAHLRVPLPKDLSGSGIFTLKTTTSYPESYFLMRRSSDGFISATGMFKAAFPWASLAEEEEERRFQKTFPSAGPEEVAGSVWVAPEEALQLADEYGMRLWIEALLDPAPIEKGSKDRHNNHIQTPPRFDVGRAPPVILPPTSSLRSTRARSTRSASPSKISTPSRKMASPRKSRTTRSAVKPDAEGTVQVATVAAASALSNIIENGDNASEPVVSVSINGEVKDADTVRIEVQETVEKEGNVETTTTHVKIDVPSDHPALPNPEDPTELIESAKRMVEEAQKLEGGAVRSSKRKVEEVSKGDDEHGATIELVERPAKQVKTAAYTTEQKLKKEQVTRRALVGLGVMAAIGTAFQYFV
ncbi:apses transcription factor-like protein [Pleomassaria siparia CBS 279.74]|uniref:Apses transcription factor-like protein n=1 Tax=Pleomassaria siparia CBS 279.74 TaxID=1314801 RepID=A0A6G1K7Q0_9PLEO|nr:apses transcription factor-like protein [Pleomassaria siparia CBS 279.74]